MNIIDYAYLIMASFSQSLLDNRSANAVLVKYQYIQISARHHPRRRRGSATVRKVQNFF